MTIRVAQFGLRDFSFFCESCGQRSKYLKTTHNHVRDHYNGLGDEHKTPEREVSNWFSLFVFTIGLYTLGRYTCKGEKMEKNWTKK